MQFLEKHEVLDIHTKLLEEFGGLQGLRDEGLLDSALLAAFNRQYYEEADLPICAATYAFHLTRNHPFLDGNKRIGAAVSEIFVRLNGGSLTASNEEIFELFMGIAQGTVSREDVEQLFTRWVVIHS